MKENKLTLVISAFTMILVLIVMCTFQLKVDEQAIVTTFGSPKELKEPGLYFRAPWPIQNLVRLDARKQLFKGSGSQTMTKDGISLILEADVIWSIDRDNVLEFYKKVGEKIEVKVPKGLLKLEVLSFH